MERLRTLGVIPARGGSKAIPKKNIVDLLGKPLIGYTIEAAHAACLLDDVVVSTDCPEIASVAKSLNADVPFVRPSELATDSSDSISVVLHALSFMEKKNQLTYDVVVMLQPTTPLRKKQWIDDSIRLLADSNLDSVVSVVQVGAFHPYRMYKLDEKSELIPFVDGPYDPMMPRQALPPVYIRSGDIYSTRRSCLLDHHSLIGNHCAGLVIDDEASVNIDEPLDLEIARYKLENIQPLKH